MGHAGDGLVRRPPARISACSHMPRALDLCCARRARAVCPAHLHACLLSQDAGLRAHPSPSPLNHLKLLQGGRLLAARPTSWSSSLHDIKMDINSDEDELYLHNLFDEVRRSHEPGLCHPSMVPRSLRLASFAAISTPCRLFTRACLTLLMLC